MATLIDLSHVVEDGMVTYRGLPAPTIRDHLSRDASRAHYAEGTTFQIGHIEMVSNTGTYLDAPFHRFEDGPDLSALPLACLADLPGAVVHAPPDATAIDAAVFRGVDVRDRAVLVHTGWDRHWGSERYFDGHPYLTADAAAALRDGGATLVGIDSLNIDGTATGERPVHTTLLAAGIPVVEHLYRLGALSDARFRFHAVPVKVAGLGTFPVRAYAVVED